MSVFSQQDSKIIVQVASEGTFHASQMICNNVVSGVQQKNWTNAS